MDKLSHRELCFDLAEAKGTHFIEIPLGSVWLQTWPGNGNLGIADVVTIKPSYTRFNMDIYECKVSRADAMQDIKSGKFEKYYPHCHRLYFATHGNLIDKKELPEEVGLLVRGENGWKTVKAAKPRDINIPEQTLLSLLFFKGRTLNKRSDLSKVADWGPEYVLQHKGRLKKLGSNIKDAYRNYEYMKITYNSLVDLANKGELTPDVLKWHKKII